MLALDVLFDVVGVVSAARLGGFTDGLPGKRPRPEADSDLVFPGKRLGPDTDSEFVELWCAAAAGMLTSIDDVVCVLSAALRCTVSRLFGGGSTRVMKQSSICVSKASPGSA